MTVQSATSDNGGLAAIVPRDLPLSIFASFRRQEEAQIIEMVKTLLKKGAQPDYCAVSPGICTGSRRFLKKLNKAGLKVYKGSQVSSVLTGPAVILWDKFGELQQALGLAGTVFVGGSLAPLGGQNFMEPAASGIPTVIGPHLAGLCLGGQRDF